MAFKKLENGVDGSDMSNWASHPCAYEFRKELESEIAKGYREILKKPDWEHAQKIRAFQKVVGLLEEAQKMG